MSQVCLGACRQQAGVGESRAVAGCLCWNWLLCLMQIMGHRSRLSIKYLMSMCLFGGTRPSSASARAGELRRMWQCSHALKAHVVSGIPLQKSLVDPGGMVLSLYLEQWWSFCASLHGKL